MEFLSASLLGRLIVIIFGLLSFLIGLRYQRKIYQISSLKFQKYFWTYWGISRLGIFTLFYLILQWEVTGDVIGYYYPQAQAVLSGQHIYQDFPSSYAPLFPYFLGIVIGMVNTPLAIILVAILMEAVTLFCWRKAGLAFVDEREFRLTALLYLTAPIVLLNVAVNGQNQIWIAAFLALSVLLAVRKKDFWAGLAFSGALVLVKFLALLFLPILFFLAKDRIKWSIGFLVLPILIYGYLILIGQDILIPFKAESVLTSAGNIPYVVTSFMGIRNGLTLENNSVQLFFYAILLLGLSGLILLFFGNRKLTETKYFPAALTLFLALFLLLSNKSQTSYLVIGWFPLCLLLAKGGLNKTKTILFFALSTVTILEPAFWYRSQFISLDIIWSKTATLQAWRNGIFMLLLDTILIISYWQLIKISSTLFLAEIKVQKLLKDKPSSLSKSYASKNI